MSNESTKSKKWIWFFVVVVVIAIAFFTLTGFFVVQPLGSIPNGVTIWYFRAGLNLPFISSPDGILLEKQESFSLLERGVVLAQVGKLVMEQEIARFQYSESLYLRTTGGRKFN